MKTSNKLLLGFFLLVIVIITAGFIYLRLEIKKAKLIDNKQARTQEIQKYNGIKAVLTKHSAYIYYPRLA